MEIKKGGEISESHSAWAVAYVLQKAPAYLAKKRKLRYDHVSGQQLTY